MTDSIRVMSDQDVCVGCGRSETHKNVCLICHGSDTLDEYRERVRSLKEEVYEKDHTINALHGHIDSLASRRN